MLVRPAALLCLDEPTNHLDLASREVLESALAEFPGTIVFISHDRYFINRIATVVVEVAGGKLGCYPGTYDDYLDAKARGIAAEQTTASVPVGDRWAVERAPAPRRPAPIAPPATAAAPGTRVTAPAPEPGRPAVRLVKKKPTAQVRELRQRVEEVERRINGLEARIKEIGAALGDPRLYLDGDRVRAVSGERKAAEEEMAGLLREWEDLSTALAAHE
jgi:ATP-binding cassette subfamily F protein 3